MLDVRAVLMGLVFAAIWSSAFTSAKLALAYAPPFLMLSIRFAISGLAALAIALLAGESLRFTRRQWLVVTLFGLCQNALYLGLNFLAMTRVEAGLAAIIASSLPLLVAASSVGILSERLRPFGWAGLALGAAGVLMIMLDRLSQGGDALGVALCVIGVLALTAATLLLQVASPGRADLGVIGLQMIVGSVALAPVALLETWDIDWTATLIAAFLYTTFVPGLLATIIWFRLVKRIGPTRAATFHFLNPFLGVAIAWAVLGERLTAQDLVGVAVIMAGILMVQTSRIRA